MSPIDVKSAISLELKKRRITHEQAAKAMGMKSRQSFSNLLVSSRYFSPAHAAILSDKYDFNYVFLTTGEGHIYKTTNADAEYESRLLRNYVSRTQYRLVLTCLDTVVKASKNPSFNRLLQLLDRIIDILETHREIENTEFVNIVIQYNHQLALVRGDFEETLDENGNFTEEED